MTCPNVVESGVYLLGALSPGERQAYERHLTTCAECRSEVSDLAALPGLLGRIDEAALAEVSTPAAPATVLPTVLSKVRRRRRSRRTFAFAGALAAACLALVAGLLMPPRPSSPNQGNGASSPPVSSTHPTSPPSTPPTSPTPTTPVMVAMVPTKTDPGLTAMISVTGTSAGTRIDGTCTYVESNPYQKAGNYSLWVVPKSGRSTAIGSWRAELNKTVPVVGQTWWPLDQLKRIELRDSRGQVVLYYNL